MIIVVDDEDRENEGDLTIAAEKVTPEAINFMARYGRGLICLSMTPERLDELEIPLMVRAEHARGSRPRSACRSRRKGRTTHRHLGAPTARRPCWRRSIRRRGRRDLARPGHMFPLRARTGGVLVRAGQTEAAVDLARIAGLYPAGVICEIMNEDGTMARVPELAKFAKKHGLLMITIADLDQVPDAHRVARQARRRRRSCRPSTATSTIHVFENQLDKQTHVALVAATSATARTCWCACTRSA